eukprot:c8026_g1_i1.p1 GENE.c8026_g1_i1~~c8026_g1_i1.p1  ORF type:complete len:453 (-),score=100.39 c8026_g1_i1:1239-2552(-)
MFAVLCALVLSTPVDDLVRELVQPNNFEAINQRYCEITAHKPLKKAFHDRFTFEVEGVPTMDTFPDAFPRLRRDECALPLDTFEGSYFHPRYLDSKSWLTCKPWSLVDTTTNTPLQIAPVPCWIDAPAIGELVPPAGAEWMTDLTQDIQYLAVPTTQLLHRGTSRDGRVPGYHSWFGSFWTAMRYAHAAASGAGRMQFTGRGTVAVFRSTEELRLLRLGPNSGWNMLKLYSVFRVIDKAIASAEKSYVGIPSHFKRALITTAVSLITKSDEDSLVRPDTEANQNILRAALLEQVNELLPEASRQLINMDRLYDAAIQHIENINHDVYREQAPDAKKKGKYIFMHAFLGPDVKKAWSHKNLDPRAFSRTIASNGFVRNSFTDLDKFIAQVLCSIEGVDGYAASSYQNEAGDMFDEEVMVCRHSVGKLLEVTHYDVRLK